MFGCTTTSETARHPSYPWRHLSANRLSFVSHSIEKDNEYGIFYEFHYHRRNTELMICVSTLNLNLTIQYICKPLSETEKGPI